MLRIRLLPRRHRSRWLLEMCAAGLVGELPRPRNRPSPGGQSPRSNMRSASITRRGTFRARLRRRAYQRASTGNYRSRRRIAFSPYAAITGPWRQIVFRPLRQLAFFLTARCRLGFDWGVILSENARKLGQETCFRSRQTLWSKFSLEALSNDPSRCLCPLPPCEAIEPSVETPGCGSGRMGADVLCASAVATSLRRWQRRPPSEILRLKRWGIIQQKVGTLLNCRGWSACDTPKGRPHSLFRETSVAGSFLPACPEAPVTLPGRARRPYRGPRPDSCTRQQSFRSWRKRK